MNFLFFKRKISPSVRTAFLFGGISVIWVLACHAVLAWFVDDDMLKMYLMFLGSVAYILAASCFFYSLFRKFSYIPSTYSYQLTPVSLSVLYAALSYLWFAVFYTAISIFIDDPLTKVRAITSMALLFASATASLLFIILRSTESYPGSENKSNHSPVKLDIVLRIITLFFILAFIVPLVNYSIMNVFGSRMKEEAVNNLYDWSKLKADHFQGWFGERQHAGAIALNTGGVIQDIKNMERRPDQKTIGVVHEKLSGLQQAQQYKTMVLYDMHGRVLMTLGEPPVETRQLQDEIYDALADKKRNQGDMSHGGDRVRHHSQLEMLVPLFSHDEDQSPLGVMLLRIDSDKYLRSYLKNWSAAESDKETVFAQYTDGKFTLFRADKNEQNKTVVRRLPEMSSEILDAIKEKGIQSGRIHSTDHLGNSVLAAWQPIKGTNWFLIAKVDDEKLLAPLRNLAFWVSSITVCILFVVGLVLMFLWRTKRRTRQLAMKLQEEQLLSNFYTLPFIGMGIMTPEMDRWLQLNDKLCEILGYPREELIQKSWNEITLDKDCTAEIESVKILQQKEKDEHHEEKTLVRKNGEIALVDFRLRCVLKPDDSVDYLIITLEDITARKAAENQIKRLNQLYAALSHCNQAIVHSSNRDVLFRKICQGVVEFGEMESVWIGLIDRETGVIAPSVAYSVVPEYIDRLMQSRTVIDTSNPTGTNPSSLSICEKRPVWIQDSATETRWPVWSGTVTSLGVRAAASIPLFQNKEIIGVMNVYSGEVNPFDLRSQNLLLEMVGDIGFALDNFQRETARTKAERELKENEQRYRWLYNERMEAEAEIRRLNRLYAALSQCNQSVVRCETQMELYQEICSVMIQYGEMKMAWVGLIDKTTLQVYPVASYGDNRDYLNGLVISVRGDEPSGQGPVGIAVRENRPVWTQDYMNDSLMVNWRDRITRSGWQSAATLPLRKGGIVIGVLIIYSEEVNAFDEASRNLLLEMSENIDFALDYFDREEQLKLSAQIFEQSNDGIMLQDCQNRTVLVNKAFTEITGYTREEAIGQDPRMLASGRHDKAFYEAMWKELTETDCWQGEIWNRRKSGEVYSQWLSIRAIREAHGDLTHYVSVFTDLTERKKTEERIYWLAHFDDLTGLPNRTLLADRGSHAIRMAERRNSPLTLMFLDIDHFKNVNDSLGHRIGDELLKQYALRLQKLTRNQDTVSRLGGDEFVLILPGTDSDGAAYLAERLLHATAEPYAIERHEIIVSTSIGIAMYPTDGASFEALWRSADAAMYRAKLNGRNNYCFFTVEMQEQAVRTLLLDNALRRAMERDQFTLHYQPQMSLKNGKIIGVEALIRWHHPDLGTIPPMEFIPIAETNGMIIPIGEWVLRTAVRQFKEWLDKGFDLETISVNLSAVQFRHPRLSTQVIHILAEANLPPECLILELTESITMENPVAAIAVIDELHTHKIRLSIDDFGTGYSSLAYLKRFNVHSLKIDRSFIQDVPSDVEDIAIVEAIISLAENLEIQAVAEGVETKEQLDFLHNRGCTEIQGYHLSRPMPASEIEGFLLAHHNPFE